MTILDPDKPKHAAADGRLNQSDDLADHGHPSGQRSRPRSGFLWQDGELLIYGAARGPKNRNITANPHVSCTWRVTGGAAVTSSSKATP